MAVAMGAGGGGLGALKMSRRTSGVQVFRFHPLDPTRMQTLLLPSTDAVSGSAPAAASDGKAARTSDDKGQGMPSWAFWKKRREKRAGSVDAADSAPPPAAAASESSVRAGGGANTDSDPQLRLSVSDPPVDATSSAASTSPPPSVATESSPASGPAAPSVGGYSVFIWSASHVLWAIVVVSVARCVGFHRVGLCLRSVSGLVMSGGDEDYFTPWGAELPSVQQEPEDSPVEGCS